MRLDLARCLHQDLNGLLLPMINCASDVKEIAETLTRSEKILGLEPGVSEEEIKSAHHRLMSKIHPDHGGSTYLATRINQAKDVLLNQS